MGISDQFVKRQYLNLETFRKNGLGVKTPVWFVQVGEVLYVTTAATSGKVKRIRNNGRVNVTPCSMAGRPIGTWVPAQARELTGPEDYLRVNNLLNSKYGLMKKLFDGPRHRHGDKDTVLEIKLMG